MLSPGETVEVAALEENGAFLVFAARPRREPVPQYGPFVMNTREEAERTIADDRNGHQV